MSRVRAVRIGSSLCLVVCLALSACSKRPALQQAGRDQPRPAVLVPGDELEDVDASVRLQFDRPMVGAEEVGPTLERPPVQIAPEIPLHVHWEDRQTLVIGPENEWRAGARYTLRFQTHEFVFDVQPLRSSGVALPVLNMPRKPEFVATFTLPVAPGEVERNCALQDSAGKRAALTARRAVDAPDGADGVDRQRVQLRAREQLPMDTRYVLDCRGLTPLGGGAPWRADKVAGPGFTTHGVLALKRTWPAASPVLPPEQVQICLELTTPVSDEQLARHVHVVPEPDEFDERWASWSCGPDPARQVQGLGDRGNVATYAPRQKYRFTIDPELTDEFGQKLGKRIAWEMETGDRMPGVWTDTSFGRVLEAGRREHALGALNVKSAELRCVPVLPAQFAKHYEALSEWFSESQRYVAPGDPAPQPVAAPWQLLGAAPRLQQLDVAAQLNVGKKLPLDLGASCVDKAGRAGLYAYEIAPQAERVTSLEFQNGATGRALTNVTDLAVIAKRGRTSALAWVTRLSTGEVVPQAKVELFDPQGAVLGTAQTDSRGLARLLELPSPAEGANEVFAVRAEDDVAIVGSAYPWQAGLSAWNLSVREASSDAIAIFVHTDRGVYRPGERVYVHGLARELSDTAPARVPADRHVSIELSDGGSEKLIQRQLVLSEFGSFATELDLPPHVAPGSLSLMVTVAGKTDYQSVSVAEFKPLSFELSGGPQRSEVLAGETVQIDVLGKYLFGPPLSAADVHLTVERMPAEVRAHALEGFRFDDASPALPEEEPWPRPERGIALERDAKTDAEGRAGFSFSAETVRRPARYAISIEATDEAKDRAARSFTVLAHSAERYAGVRVKRAVLGLGEPVEAEVAVVDREGKRAAGTVELELRQASWDCSARPCQMQVLLLGRQDVQVAASGATPTVRFPALAKAGTVHIRATTRDASGRIARGSDSSFVYSGAGDGPDVGGAAPLLADRPSYRIGDRARLALQTPRAPAHWLVTSERAEILSAEVVARGSTLPELPLTAAHAPNVFAYMVGMTPRTAAGYSGVPRVVAGARELHVSRPPRALATEIKLARDRFEPGERVSGEVVVSHLGRPVLAEVALVAVNESVLQLTGFETPNPARVFHAPRGLGVRTLSNLESIIGDPAQAAEIPEVYYVNDGGGDGSGARPDVRDDYVAAAYVAPQLRTDAKGRVQFSFDAPADLSAYRLMAVVAAKDDRVGSADARLTVAQPLSAKLLAPRFGSRGDRLELGAFVHDSTGQGGPVDVRFEAKGLALEQSRLQLMASASGTPAHTRATVQDVDQAWFEVEVHKSGKADRVGHTLAVRRPLDTELRVLAHARQPAVRVPLAWPKGIDPALSQLEITVDRAGLAGLAPMLAMVLDYPYGCTEQTAAALSAIAAAPELARAIVPGWSDPKALSAHVADGIARLVSARGPDGQFGLYPGLGGRLWLTALVLEAGLALRDAGFAVPAAISTEAAGVLAQGLSRRNPQQLSAAELDYTAHALWLLSRGDGAPGVVLEQVWAQRQRLSPDGTAYLLRAGVLAGKPEAFRAPLRSALRGVGWLERVRDLEAPLSSAERTTAIALAALLVDARETELIERLAGVLIERAIDPGVYLSTRDVAETLSALSAWAARSKAGANRVRVGLAEGVLWEGTLTGAQVVALTRAARDAASGNVWVEADGDVTASIRRRDVSPSAPKPAFSKGLSLERRYLDPKTKAPAGAVARGDIVLVELDLRSDRNVRMLALADPMPAGFEPLDPSLSSGRLAGCDTCDDAAGFDHVRRHDDRIEAFAEWLPAGKHAVRYLLRATTAGTFTAPGATATLMYAPNYFARSRVDSVVVR